MTEAETFDAVVRKLLSVSHEGEHSRDELKDERYNELIVEVADPQAAAELVKSELPAKFR